ncbi:DUF4399 domain-containing protein [Beijerinckia indica]|uniref:DUF4399 domain-containing protein n=1 Tax=Beijerinckia indica subsp. indica (strain ATCC 9039 / DSM 1715 / NCIMB 8712) TaxID=395963 RepID=B2IIX9_BEII9|nr:DUF4399 domain-containing protein [Beijerinckia indica]ACB96191.1 conserved hypothetical protein [Beijerinckia indica subsp. indica ATCC 9039]
MKLFQSIAAVTVAVILAIPVHAASPHVYFIEPVDGEHVSSPFTVKFGLEGLEIRPAGDATPNTGHHHLIVDGIALPTGTVIALNDKSLHFGKGQTETQLSLPPGHHTLTLQFGDGIHQSYGLDVSQTISIDVK